MELKVRYDDGPWNFGVSVHEFRGDRIVRETIYFAEPFEAPERRAEWRAAPYTGVVGGANSEGPAVATTATRAKRQPT